MPVKDTEKTVTITEVSRANSSANGNPAWVLTFTDGSSYRTQTDAACAYEIGNPGLRAGDMVTVTITSASRIRYIKPAS